ncbi:MAG: hypothetical protein A2297_01445 [Elusimicrobia bacterium RIFOXYB2_FULL_48_7]|nr:MAG: hypothetical protein A2297_01445 [Elusimicrobia bacterium RIFOXYB2_FULL_48_7]
MLAVFLADNPSGNKTCDDIADTTGDTQQSAQPAGHTGFPGAVHYKENYKKDYYIREECG